MTPLAITNYGPRAVSLTARHSVRDRPNKGE